MESLNDISDRIERLLRPLPGGLDASLLVAELTTQGVAGDDAAAALAAGVGDRRFELDTSFRVSVAGAMSTTPATSSR